MRALVMAAGLGTRLKPLTDHTPKPLVKVNARPMIAYVLEHLAGQGITEALVNLHYFPEQMRSFIHEWNRSGAAPYLAVQDESGLLLDSGGSISQGAEWLFERNSTALVCNADVLANPDLTAFRREHARLREELGVECTLAVSSHEEVGRKYHGLRRSPDGRITQFVEKTGTPDPSLFHFPGYYLLEKQAAATLPKAGAVFGIKQELWIPLARAGKLGSFLYDGYYWDLGTPKDVELAAEFVAKRA